MAKQPENQTVDQKKGSADESVTGTRQSMPGINIARGDSSVDASARSADGGPEGNSRERKTARNGSDSNEG